MLHLYKLFSNPKTLSSCVSKSGFNIKNKINTALLSSKVEDAEIAYLQGVGFLKLGLGYELDSIKSFEKAIDLDATNRYSDAANAYLQKLRSVISKPHNETDDPTFVGIAPPRSSLRGQ